MHHFVVLLVALIHAACGPSQSTSRSRGVSIASNSSTATQTTSSSAGGPAAVVAPEFGVEPFAFGPYLLAQANITAETVYLLEFGMIDIRRQNADGSGVSDLFDFRWKTIAAAVTTGGLAWSLGPGCGEPKPAQFQDQADIVKVSGALSKELTGNSAAVFIFDDQTAAAQDFDASKGLVANFRKQEETLASISAPPPPQSGSLRVSGAYDATLNLNFNVHLLSEQLASATGPLKLSEDGGGAYDLAVVTFLGSANAKLPVLRCLMPRGGTVSLAEQQYKSLLPLRGFFTIYAKLSIASDGAANTWSAAVFGDGAYDETVMPATPL